MRFRSSQCLLFLAIANLWSCSGANDSVFPTITLQSRVSPPPCTRVATAFVTNSNHRRCIIPPSASRSRGKSRIITTAQPSKFSGFETAFEWLANDRVAKEPDRHQKIRFFSPSALGEEDVSISSTNVDNDTTDGAVDGGATQMKRMPFYPLGAVHVPFSGENHTLINIEPRNVKMARDIVSGKWDNSLFCVSLRARDTNRVASIGTVMQLLDAEDRLPSLSRVVVTCKAVGVAEVVALENPQVWDIGNEDYLIAKVKVWPPNESTNKENESDVVLDTSTLAQQIIDDYQEIRSIYINSQSIASNELPKFARNVIKTIPDFNHTTMIQDESKFWTLVDTWQKMCNTIREAKRVQLQGIVDELSVDMAEMIAKSKGGPLELPVRRNDLPEAVQKSLVKMEEKASRDFVELGMDPVLDFQELLSMERHWDRVAKMGWMIEKERSRLEAKESLIRALLKDVEGQAGGLSNSDGFN